MRVISTGTRTQRDWDLHCWRYSRLRGTRPRAIVSN